MNTLIAILQTLFILTIFYFHSACNGTFADNSGQKAQYLSADAAECPVDESNYPDVDVINADLEESLAVAEEEANTEDDDDSEGNNEEYGDDDDADEGDSEEYGDDDADEAEESDDDDDDADEEEAADSVEESDDDEDDQEEGIDSQDC